MIIGDLTNVLESEQTILESIQNNFNNAYNNINKKSKISKLLTKLSNFGMSYDDDVIQKMKAIPADKIFQPKNDPIFSSTLFGSLLSTNYKKSSDEEKPFYEKALSQKLEVLRAMSQQPELEDILDVMANESIVYDDTYTYICEPYIDTSVIYDLNEASLNELKGTVDTSFYKLYMLLNWKKTAWNTYKRWLIDGVLAYEIVYDNLENPKTILNIVEIDPNTLTRKFENGIFYWIQFCGVIGQERKLLDSQIIYIKYEDTGVSSRQSYLERLIRPFNLYRIVEQAQVIWTVTQSSFKTMFTIPIGEMNKAKGMQTLAAAMNRYKEDISFNQDTGELKVNGKPNMPFNKEYWLPENSTGRPEIETLVDNGPTLNDSDQIKYFENKLYKMSKIPANRFDKEAQATWFGADPTAATREEIDFSRFVTRLRNAFAEILLKPLRIQVALLLPNIKNDKRILEAISLQFHSYNLFEEQMKIEVETRRAEHIGTLKDSLTVTDADGNEVPFFSMKFLIERYLKFSDADFELNEKYKRLEELEKKKGKDKKEDEDSEGEDDDLSLDNESEEKNKEEGSESESEGIDDEMLGDVQPESSETTTL